MIRDLLHAGWKFRAAAACAILMIAGSANAANEPDEDLAVPADPSQAAPAPARRPAARAPAAAPATEVRFVERAFHIGVGLGMMVPDSDPAYDPGFYLDIRFTVEYRDLTELEFHLVPNVSYETDSDLPSGVLDVDSNVISVNVKSYFARSGPIDVYSRIGIGWMINEADAPIEVNDNMVVPIALGISFEAIPDRLNVGLELGHWLTEAEVRGGPELDASMFIATASYKF